MKKIRRRIKKAVKENRKKVLAPDHVDGHPWSGSPEDLVQAQSRTWGGGDVVDPKGYSTMINQAIQFTQGAAKSPLQERRGKEMKINREMLKKLLEQIEMEVELERHPFSPPIDEEGPQEIPGVETKEDAWSGGENLDAPIDWQKEAGAESNVRAPETLEITEAKLRQLVRATILKEMNNKRR